MAQFGAQEIWLLFLWDPYPEHLTAFSALLTSVMQCDATAFHSFGFNQIHGYFAMRISYDSNARTFSA